MSKVNACFSQPAANSGSREMRLVKPSAMAATINDSRRHSLTSCAAPRQDSQMQCLGIDKQVVWSTLTGSPGAKRPFCMRRCIPCLLTGPVTSQTLKTLSQLPAVAGNAVPIHLSDLSAGEISILPRRAYLYRESCDFPVHVWYVSEMHNLPSSLQHNPI
jgi:hypothetical protein